MSVRSTEHLAMTDRSTWLSVPDNRSLLGLRFRSITPIAPLTALSRTDTPYLRSRSPSRDRKHGFDRSESGRVFYSVGRLLVIVILFFLFLVILFLAILVFLFF